MYRKIVWCYVLVLTLLDISLNTKLTAQGKSHDVTVHDSLIEGISFQEWGKDVDENAVGSSTAAEALRLTPAALGFGRAALGAAHALSVTLTNTHNATVHLASVAGTTPDFHASFFESKTLPPNGNTTFSVVYLGRREGPVTAYLYIHTSLGVHKYPVSAEGVASEWGVWPLVGLRVPHNATLDPVLTLYNPTDKPIQVREVYSSGSWVGLRLPGGGGAAPREAWRVPPHAERALVRLQLRLPAPSPHPHAHPHPPHPHQPHQPHQPQHSRPLTAYIRIKGDNVGGGGGGLVVAVEATAAPPGAFLAPPQLRLRARGSRDPPHTFDISAGNSGSSPVRVEASVWGARCSPQPLDIPPPPAPPDHHHTANGQLDRVTTNGVKSEGAHVTVLRPQLDAHQEATQTLQLTLDYARLWASYSSSGSGSGAPHPSHGMWCGGYVRMGACAVPYSLRLLPGTLHLTPQQIEVVTAGGAAGGERAVRVHNQLPRPALLAALHYPPALAEHFHVVDHTPLVLEPDAQAVVGRLRLRPEAAGGQLHSRLAIHTNLTLLELPVLLHSGALELEWDWPNSLDGNLRVGAVGASSTRRIGVQLYNPTPATLCVREHSVQLPAAQFTLPACRCIEGGSRAQAWLTVVAPARPGPLAGSVHVSTPHAETRATVTLHAHAGRLRAPPLRLAPAAPYAWSSAPLVLESSMALGMRLVNVSQPQPDPAVTFVPSGSGWVTAGKHTVGTVYYAPERACEPRCYTGLDLHSPEGAAWVSRGEAGGAAGAGGGAREDAELLRARRALFAPRHLNVTLYVHTTEVVQIPVSGSVQAEWPRLRVDDDMAEDPTAPDAAPGRPGRTARAAGLLAAVGSSASMRLRLRNPSSLPLLLYPTFTHHHYHHRPHDTTPYPAHHDPDHLLHPQDVEGIESFCKKNKCVWSHEAFSVSAWQAAGEGGGVRERAGGLLLAPAAELLLTVAMAPARAAPLAAYLYLRNNLTVVEIVPVWGRGAYPSFELGGRRPGSTAPLLFEVTECGGGGTAASGGGGGGGGGGGVLRRAVLVHNTGDVPLRLRDWRLAGRPCQARGFRLQPCAPLALAPNETRVLRLAFAADYTLARVTAALHVRTDTQRAEFALQAHAAAALLRACAAPRPPFEPPLRAAGALLALAALALVLAAAALDAERELRRARAARAAAPPPARAPLDLRAAAAPPAPAPPARPPPPRRRRAARRVAPLDPQAERRAFERWRAEVLRRPSAADDDHSSEEAAPPDPVPRNRSPSPPTPTDRRSSDEEGPSAESSVGSDSSRADELGRDDSDGPERPSPRASPAHHPAARRPPNDTDNRTEEGRRAGRTRSPPRRTERRAESAGRARAGGLRAAARRERGARRRPPAPPPPPPEPRAPAAVRWDTTWSSVVAAAPPAPAPPSGGPTPLPPIGSDVRRRPEAERPPADNSLFYFNGEQPPPAPGWRTTPPLDRPAFPPPQPDYRAEFEDSSSMNAYGSLWTGPGASAWAWGGGFAGVRPPPGFAAPPPAPRAYDPFRSLAAIWAPGALDWRPDPEPAPAAAAAAAAALAPPADAHASSLDAPASRSVVSKTE